MNYSEFAQAAHKKHQSENGMLGSALAEFPTLRDRVFAKYAALSKREQALMGALPELRKTDGRPKTLAAISTFLAFDEKLASLPAAVSPAPKPAASIPAPSLKPATSVAESVGRVVLAAAANPDPKVSKPVLTGLARAIELHRQSAKPKATAPLPDLSSLTGLERAIAAHEFRKTGALSERSAKLIQLRKTQQS